MGTSLSSTPNIIIYPATDQLYESNVGGSELKDLTLPTFITKGNRLLLAYNGSYEQLGQELKEAIARSIWEAQLNGTSVEAQATGATQETVPHWFKEGAICYMSNGWQIKDEDALQKIFRQNQFHGWEEVISKHQTIAGLAFCYFLTEKYLPTAVMQTYVQLRKRKPLPTAVRLITKRRIDSLYSQCVAYYQARFNVRNVMNVGNVFLDSLKQKNANAKEQTIAVKHVNGRILQILPDAKNEYIAYVLSTPFTRTVYTYNIKTKATRKQINYNLPPWINDHSDNLYPIISWSANGKELLVTLPEKGKLVVKHYDPNGGFVDRNTLNGTDGISTIQELKDNQFLLSAWRNGESDIVLFNDRKDKYKPLTNDTYDDRSPAISGDEFYFSSNRPDSNRTKKRNNPNGKDTLVNAQGIYKRMDKGILPVHTDTIPYIHYDQPQLLADGSLLYSSTENGTLQYFIETGGERKIIAQPKDNFFINAAKHQMITWTTTKDSLFINSDSIRTINSENKIAPWLVDYNARAAARAKEDSILKAARDDKPSFLDGVLKAANQASDSKSDSAKHKAKGQKNKIANDSAASPYVLQLYSAYFSAQVNNDYYINRYQPYLNYQGQFKFPEIGGMAQGGFSDLFENHHFTVAYRIPAGTEGSTFFIRYRNTKRKLDWGVAYYRNVDDLKPDPKRNWIDETGNPYPNAAKVKTHYYELSASYPLSYYSKFDFTTALREDRTVFLATDEYSLTYPAIKSLWSINALSYELKKLRPTLPNLYKGFTAKAGIDLFKGFTQEQSALTGCTAQFSYHQPIYKYITLVTRLQGGYSGGDHKVLYTLGGVDNNVAPKIDSNVHFAQNAPYAFTTLVTPFRGYYQNSLYGNEYAVFNADLYFPVFQTLIPIETPLSSINNLQLGIFSDIATAKETWNDTKQGFKTAYGLSARTTLAGYPISVQVGWPGTFSKEPVWYLGLSLK
ncbi:hypothetical protein DN068_07035 [Taibaiella soli]|uniref:Bacterial surface antigen (D15) domain-containing protein n=2 Tax=Taibaiella soli TaxID=1649169 RepID=A0A2W2B0F1_9BACT|nr:hypothetical protein DN068_07035 [Taibaiella soli]